MKIYPNFQIQFKRTFSLLLSILAGLTIILLVVGAPLTQRKGPTLAFSSPISGTVYRDFNADGVQGAQEFGIADITVTAYDDAGFVTSTLTLASGDFVLAGLATTITYRIEFTDLPNYLQPGVAGPESRTTVTFANGSDSDVDLALHNPGQYCQDNPDIASTCFVFGEGVSGYDTVVTFPYTSGTTSLSSNATVAFPAANNVALDSDTGAVWGVAWSRTAEKLFATSMMRRHVAFGDLGTGGIYLIDPVLEQTTPFLDLEAMFPNSAGPDYHDMNDLLLDGPDSVAHPVWDAVGKTSLGSLTINEVGDRMWVASLYDRKIYEIELEVGTAVTYTNVTSFPLPDPGTAPASSSTPGCPFDPNYTPPAGVGYVVQPATQNFDNPDLQLGAIKHHDGALYIGMTCTAETTGLDENLRMFVYRMDPDGTFTQVVNDPLNYPRRNGRSDPGSWLWNPWVPNESYTGGNSRRGANPQPWLLDIEFDEQGFMVVALNDRFSFQSGNDRNAAGVLEGVAAGDILRLEPLQDGAFELEGNGTSGGITTAFPDTNTGPCDENGDCAEYYWSDRFQMNSRFNRVGHREITTGGLTQWLGSGEVLATVYDPAPVGGRVPLPDGSFATQSYRSAGIVGFSHADGGRTTSYQYVYLDQPGTFGKAATTGDLALLCQSAPIEIGNRVWLDEDRDGIQDPNEPIMPGVTVYLYDMDNGAALVGTAITGPNGEYLFGGIGDTNMSGGPLQPLTNYEIRIDLTDANLLANQVTQADATGQTVNDNIADLADNDAEAQNGFSIISVQTGQPGENNHTLDFGFVETVSVGSYVWFDADHDGFQDTDEVGIDGAIIELLVDDGNGNFGPAVSITGTAVLSQTTAEDGLYFFDNLPEGDYRIRVTPPTHLNPTFNQQAADNDDSENDSNIASEPISGTFESGTFTLEPGQEPMESGDEEGDMQDHANNLNGNMTIDFGFIELLTLGNIIWFDEDRDGEIDDNESGVPEGVIINLLDENENPILDANNNPITTTTDDNGNYLFTDLVAGDYVVQIDPINFQADGPLEGYISTGGSVDPDSSDSDIDDNGIDGSTPAVDGIITSPVTLDYDSEPDNFADTDNDDNTNLTIDLGIVIDPTAVNLTLFKATNLGEGRVNVQWSTASEVDNFGFRIYRSFVKDFSTATEVHFEPTAVTGGTGPGTDYSYEDTGVPNGTVYYWLVDVETGGATKAHGPIIVQVHQGSNLFLPVMVKGDS
ncbi:MAG: SdrD B-like domain-containing protein [Chloroflexota bacterium]